MQLRHDFDASSQASQGFAENSESSSGSFADEWMASRHSPGSGTVGRARRVSGRRERGCYQPWYATRFYSWCWFCKAVALRSKSSTTTTMILHVWIVFPGFFKISIFTPRKNSLSFFFLLGMNISTCTLSVIIFIIFITPCIWRDASVRALVGKDVWCEVYLLTCVCLLHELWHVSKNIAAPFLKDVRLEADCRTAGRQLKVSAPW